MYCATCRRYLETVARKVEGVIDATASYATEMMCVRYDEDLIEPPTIAARLSAVRDGVALPRNGESGRPGPSLAFDRRRTVFAVLLMMPVLALYALFVLASRTRARVQENHLGGRLQRRRRPAGRRRARKPTRRGAPAGGKWSGRRQLSAPPRVRRISNSTGLDY